MSDRENNLQSYVSDMLAVESHTLEAVERQVGSDSVKHLNDASQLIGNIHYVLKQNTASLEKRLETLGGGQSVLKTAAASVVGAVAGVYDQVRSEAVSRMLRDDYTALSLVAISYTMLHTTALALQDAITADLALQNLKRITPLVMEISKVIPAVVAHDVQDDVPSANVSVAKQAVTNTQTAWDAKHISTVQAMPV